MNDLCTNQTADKNPHSSLNLSQVDGQKMVGKEARGRTKTEKFIPFQNPVQRDETRNISNICTLFLIGQTPA